MELKEILGIGFARVDGRGRGRDVTGGVYDQTENGGRKQEAFL